MGTVRFPQQVDLVGVASGRTPEGRRAPGGTGFAKIGSEPQAPRDHPSCYPRRPWAARPVPGPAVANRLPCRGTRRVGGPDRVRPAGARAVLVPPGRPAPGLRRRHPHRHVLPAYVRGYRRARRPGAEGLRNVLYARLAAGDAHVILDGTLISSGRVSETTVGAKVCTGVTTGRGSAAIAVARSSSPPRQQSARIDPPGVLFYSRIEYLGDDARVAAHGRAVVLTPPCELRMECSRYATLGSEVESVPASADLSAGTPSGRDGMI